MWRASDQAIPQSLVPRLSQDVAQLAVQILPENKNEKKGSATQCDHLRRKEKKPQSSGELGKTVGKCSTALDYPRLPSATLIGYASRQTLGGSKTTKGKAGIVCTVTRLYLQDCFWIRSRRQKGDVGPTVYAHHSPLRVYDRNGSDACGKSREKSGRVG